MRIIGRLPDARMQITVFDNDGRFPVQFELAGITQIYRFRKGERLSNMGHLRDYIDEPFRAAVLRQFGEMQRIQAGVINRIEPQHEGDQLPDII
ncbi:hypothetical protein GGR28_001150 [Lewinella aquimaris]|uniref:Uncharacterized protein n=1 Tax=Neolewinella aquimaris TaxID=1835722 RepID=A0A840E5T6_9BACT|nr:hypothetical protein [Neolewinella aquimaris]MBB4078537.1 hypothetical protein [Neolewinella aquimaris]